MMKKQAAVDRSALSPIAGALLLCALAAGCGKPPEPAPASLEDLAAVPLPALAGMEEPVQRQLRERHAAVEALRQEALGEQEDTEPNRLGEAYGELGQLFHAYGLGEAAQPAYENASALLPEDHRWPYYLGHLHQDRGELDAAEAQFRQAQEAQPAHLGSILHRGRVLLDLNRLDEAEPLLEKALEIDPACAPAHYALGKVAAARGDSEEAVARFEKALELQPGASIVHYPLSQAYRDLGDLEAAERHLAQRGTARIAFDDPLLGRLQQLAATSGAFLTQAGTESRQGLLSEAVETYKKAVEADPGNATTRRDYAFALAEAGRGDEAIPELEKALELDPGNPLVHNALGVLFGQRGEVEKALGQFEQAVADDPRFEDGLFNLATAQARLERKEEALATTAQVLAVNPQHGQALGLRAQLLAEAGDGEGARKALQEAVALRPNDLGLRQQLAQVHRALGNNAAAVEQYEAILERAPQVPERGALHLEAANLLREEGNHAAAVSHYQKALEADPSLSEARFNLAGTLGLTGRYGEALPHFKALIEAEPKNEIFRLSEATALAFEGRFANLRQRLEEGIEEIPQSAALGLLYARLLAASPDEAQRNPQQSLAIAREAYGARPSPASAETLAMAFAATGDHAKAADIQKQLLDRLSDQAAAETLQRWRRHYENYQAGRGCCPETVTGEAAVERLFGGLYSG